MAAALACDKAFDARPRPYARLGDAGGSDGEIEGVPEAVVRQAWVKAAPWLLVPLPEWWAFQVRPFRPD